MVASAIPASNHAQAQTKHYGDIRTWSFGCRPNHSDCPEAYTGNRLELVGRIDTALVRTWCYLFACNRNDHRISQEQDLTGRGNTRPLFIFARARHEQFRGGNYESRIMVLPPATAVRTYQVI